MAKRIDLLSRVAGEKSQKPDEFITRSQLCAGSGITLDPEDNHDIVVNSNGDVDGGFANSVYLVTQKIDGGNI